MTASATALARAPRRQVVENLDGSSTEYDDIPIREGTLGGIKGFNGPWTRIRGKSEKEIGTLLALCRDLFMEHWDRIRFGPCIQGAVFENTFSKKPTLFSMLDGYLTVGLPHGKDHFHLCVGETRGLGTHQTPKELSRIRRCGRAAFFRDLSAPSSDGCMPRSWGIRFWNGKGEQMVSVFLPNPYLSARLKRQPADWSRLGLWNDLRRRYLGELTPQPVPEGTGIPEHG